MATNSLAIPPCVTAHPCWRCKAITTRFAFCETCGAAIKALAARQPVPDVDDEGYEIEEAPEEPCDCYYCRTGGEIDRPDRTMNAYWN